MRLNKTHSVGCVFLFAFVLIVNGYATRVVPTQLAAHKAQSGECVIMLHGLGRSASSMRPIRSALIDHGYLVVSLTYPSREFPIEVLSEDTISRLVQDCRKLGAHRIHFVTHSLCGILARHYLETAEVPERGRMVMLAPPNQGSEVADNWRNVPGYAWFLGPAGLQIGTDPQGVPSQLGPVTIDTGVIAGTRTINIILSQSLPNPDDGKVSVASTRVDNMCAHVQVPVSHPFIMMNKQVIAEVLNYLASGRFQAGEAEYPDCSFRDD